MGVTSKEVMEIRFIKLSNLKGIKENMSSTDVLNIHEGAGLRNHLVTFTTGLAIASEPDFVILVCGNTEEYACFEVEKYEYQMNKKFIPQNPAFEKYSPDKYKNEPNRSWMILRQVSNVKNLVQKIQTFHNVNLKYDMGNEISCFAKSRANNKVLKY